MTISLTFKFDDPASAADFLAKVNKAEGTPPWYDSPEEKEAAKASASPWDDDESNGKPESASKPSADPWADDAAPAKPATAKANAQHDAAGVLFPGPGKTYLKDSPTGERKWEFCLPGAPDCDCGYPAAKVTGTKGKREWSAYWCPIGYTKNWKDKCKFSEFA